MINEQRESQSHSLPLSLTPIIYMSYIYVLHAHTDVYIYICFFLSISLQIKQSTNQQRAYHSMARLYGAPGARPAAALCEAMSGDQWRLRGMWLGQGDAMFFRRDFIGGFMMFNGDLIGVGGSCDLVAV